MDFVKTMRQSRNDGPLFPGVHTTVVSNKANALIRRRGIVDPAKSHYSWRHTVCSALENVVVDSPKGPVKVGRDLARYIVGHAPIDVHAKHYLHPEIAEVRAAINGLPDPTV